MSLGSTINNRIAYWKSKKKKKGRPPNDSKVIEYVKTKRGRRKKHSSLNDSQRIKANVRSYLNVYVRRGVIVKQPCSICGDTNAQAHHEDYSKPLDVMWLCVKHHLEHHKKSKCQS